MPTCEDGCPLPENTVVSPLLCGVGFRLLPAFISASSSELSPVGDIILKDLVPAHKRRGVQLGGGQDGIPGSLLPTKPLPQPRWVGPSQRQPSAPSPWCPTRFYSLGIWPPPGGPWEFMVALGPALGTPVNLCPPTTVQLLSTTWLATQPLSQVPWLSPTKAESPYGPLPSSAKPSDPWTDSTGASMAIRLRTLECQHPAGPFLAPSPQTDSRRTDRKQSTHLRRSTVGPWETLEGGAY